MQKKAPARSIGRDLVWGLGWGAALGVVYAVIGTICWLAQPVTQDPRFRGLTFPVLLGFYLVGGPVAGIIVGLLRPLTTRRFGASMAGAIAVMPLTAAVIALFRTPLPDWGFPEVFTVIVGSALMGGMGGRILWRPRGSVFTIDEMEHLNDDPRHNRVSRSRHGRKEGS